MNAVGHASATRSPEATPARPRAANDCCAPELAAESGLPRFLAGAQAKLQVGAPDDAFEREADAVASAVVREKPVPAVRPASGAPRFQRLCAECAEKQREADLPPLAGSGVIRRLAGDPGSGAAVGGDTVSGLPGPLRRRLEKSLGTELGSVRVHGGPGAHRLAQALGARAFTHGSEIWLGARERPDDLGLMAHEVTHVLQQEAGLPAASPTPAQRPGEDEGPATTATKDGVQEASGDDPSEGADGAAGDAGGSPAGDSPAGAAGAAGDSAAPSAGGDGAPSCSTPAAGPAGGAAGEPPSPPQPFAQALARRSAGTQLPGALRQTFEQAFGVNLEPVRVHTDAAANHAAALVDADAFTLGQAVFFAPGRYRPELPGGQHLIAHELAHTLQNRRAPPAPGPLTVGARGNPAEREADLAAGAAIAGRPAPIQARPAAPVQRDEKDALDRALDWGAARLDDAGSAVASGTRAVGEFAGEKLMALVRKLAPQLADILDEGPLTFATRKINEALDAHLPAALGGFSLGELADGVAGWLGEAVAFAKDLLKGDAKACAAFAGIMEKLTGFVTQLIDNPVIKTYTKILTKAWDFVGKAIKFVAEPVFDNLAKQLSGAWTVLKKVASTVSGWIASAKEALGAAWDKVSELLGFDGSSEDGVWSYIKGVGNEIWEGIKSTLAPVLAPFRKVEGALSLLMPMGQIHAIVKYGPTLVKAAQWVWDNGLDPAKIREAPADIRGMLESLTGGVDGFKGVLQGGLDWLSEKVSALADGVLEVVGAITGLPLIGFAHALFEEAQKGLKTLVADIKQGARDALAAIEAAATRIAAFLAPYKEVLSSLILAIASPVLIPVIFAGWAWRALPACIKIPILNFLLDIAIAALNAIPEVPTFGLLWPLLKPGVMAFLGTLRASEDKVKEEVSDKIAKVLSGASPAFLIGFVKGFALGVWEGISDPFKAIWMVLEGLDTATQYLLSLAGLGEEKPAPTPQPAATAAPAPSAPAAAATPAAAPSAAIVHRPPPASAPPPVAATPAPAAPGAAGTITPVAPPTAAPSTTPGTAAASPEAAPETAPETPYAADPAAALASGAPLPEATRQLLEKLAAQQAAQQQSAPPAVAEAPAAAPVAIDPADLPAFQEQVGAVAGEIGPDVATVKGGFWAAVEEYFNSGSMSFDDMVTKLSEVWESAKAKVSEGGAWLANQLMGFFRGGGAEGELGDKVGWLTGTITFQVLLDAITAGTWIAAGPVLKGIAKFINWPMEFLGEAFKLLKSLGKYLLDGLKSLGGAIKDAAAGAFKTVSKALGNIGQRLLTFGEELLGKFGGKAARAESKAAGLIGREGTQLAEQKAARSALGEAEQKAGQKLEQQAAKVEPHPVAEPAPKTAAPTADSAAKREAGVAESGHVDSPQLSQKQLSNEIDFIEGNPHLIQEGPPRSMKIGEHNWIENPGGGWCRHSTGSVCVPKLRVTKGPELTPDNVDDIIADLKAKRSVTPDEEARLRAVAETKGGIWNLRGQPGASMGKGGVGLRGEVGHNLLGEDLPYAKIIDSAPRIDPLTGLATEVRSIKTHQLFNFQEPGTLVAQLKSEVDELAKFTTTTAGATTITAAKNAERILVIGVPPGQLEAAAGRGLTAQWRQEAQAAIDYADKKGVRIIFRTIK